MRQVFIPLVASAVAVFSAQGLFAQTQGFSGGMLGGGGGGGGGGMGGSGGMSSGMGSSGMGSGMGSSSSGGLTMLSASSLSGGFGQLGFGSMNGFGSSTGGSSMYGGRAYGAVTQAGGGASMSGGGSGGGRTSGSTSSSGGGGGGGAAGSTNRRRGGAQNASTAAKEQQAWFEPRIEIGFETSTPQMSAIASSVASSLGANKPNSRFGSVQVAFEGGTAILRGVVATPNDRILAEQVALLEPSVSAVRNDLTVAPRTNPATGK